MNKTLFLGAVAALGLSAMPAFAQDMMSSTATFGDIYAKLNVGVALPGTIRMDASPSDVNGFPAFSGTVNFDAGPAAAIALGTHFTENLRGEVMVGVATNNASSYDFGAFAGTGAATGSVTSWSAMAVGYFDFTNFGAFVPYFSFGAGVVNVSTNNLVLALNTDGTTTGSSTVPAARIGAGFDYNVTDKVSVGLDYFAVFGGRNTLTFNDPVGAPLLGVAPFSRTITADTMAHALSASLKVKF